MIIYKTTNLVSGKIYIGKDTKSDPNYLGSGTYLRNAIKKYGRDNFKKEVLETCETNEQLCEREIFWIKELDARNSSIGYNISLGGDGWDRDSASIAGKIGNSNRTSEYRSEYTSRMWKSLTPEQRSEKAKLIWKNISTEEHSKISKKAWEQFTSEEISEIRKHTWKITSPESRKKHSSSIRESWKNDVSHKQINRDALNLTKKNLSAEAKSIIGSNAVKQKLKNIDDRYNFTILQLSMDGNLISTWKNLGEIREHFSSSITRIRYCLDNKAQSALNFKWMNG